MSSYRVCRADNPEVVFAQEIPALPFAKLIARVLGDRNLKTVVIDQNENSWGTFPTPNDKEGRQLCSRLQLECKLNNVD